MGNGLQLAWWFDRCLRGPIFCSRNIYISFMPLRLFVCLFGLTPDCRWSWSDSGFLALSPLVQCGECYEYHLKRVIASKKKFHWLWGWEDGDHELSRDYRSSPFAVALIGSRCWVVKKKGIIFYSFSLLPFHSWLSSLTNCRSRTPISLIGLLFLQASFALFYMNTSSTLSIITEFQLSPDELPKKKDRLTILFAFVFARWRQNRTCPAFTTSADICTRVFCLWWRGRFAPNYDLSCIFSFCART